MGGGEVLVQVLCTPAMEQLSLLLSPCPCPPGHQAAGCKAVGFKHWREIGCNCKKKIT